MLIVFYLLATVILNPLRHKWFITATAEIPAGS
jgi:hypothetical protein